jgi:antirestriction protein ArdC
MKAKITNHDKLDKIVESLIAKVEDAGSWIKPFKSAIQGGMPINGITGKEYRGINIFTLWGTAMDKGYTSNKWFTFNQLKAKKQTVIKGEKSTQIFFFKPLLVDDKDADDGSKKTIFMLKSYNVFNLEQTDIEVEDVEVIEPTENAVIENAKEFFDNLDYLEVEEHPQPHYNPRADTIGIPSINDFVSAEEYYSTLGHEFIHSTGIESRCNRDNFNSSKKSDYAFEELVAEIGSIFVMARLGLDAEPIQDNSAAYLKGWLRALKDDKKMLWKASSQAHKAFEFLDDLQYENTEAQVTLEVA